MWLYFVRIVISPLPTSRYAPSASVIGPLLKPQTVGGSSQSQVQKTLQSFHTVGLADVSDSLLTRSDTKFLLSLSSLQSLLPSLAEDYAVLKIGAHRLFDYHNLYLDSPDLHLFNDHHRGVYARHKLRYRYYQQTHDTFLELKTKNASKQTVKLRERLGTTANHAEVLESFRQKTGLAEVSAKLRGRYKRISLVSKTDDERLTLDLGLQFGLPDKNHTVHLENLVVAELKQPRRSSQNPFTARIRGRALKASFSKYCVGCCYLYPELKTNYFKPLLHQLDKLSE